MTEPNRYTTAAREITTKKLEPADPVLTPKKNPVSAKSEAAVLPMPMPWKRDLIVSSSGTARPILANALHALRNASELRGVIARDMFALRTIAKRATPWKSSGAWTEVDDAKVTEWLHHNGIYVSVDVAARAVETVAAENSFDPLCNYLDGLKWDGNKRLELFVQTYLGGQDSPYNRTIGTKTLIAAVARAKKPGCKVDTVTILEGLQGAGKSTAWGTLGGEFFTDDFPELGTKDASQQTAGAWIIELPELDAMSRAEQGKIKAFISRGTDRFRPAYGKRIVEVPRRSLFVGSVNLSTYLRDETGARRFWPVHCGKVDLVALKRDRDQLWAEAVRRYEDGQNWWIDDPAMMKAATDEQSARYEGDAWQGLIADFAEQHDSVSVEEILLQVLNKTAGQWTPVDQNRVARCLRALGMDRYLQRIGDSRKWRYRKGNPA